MRDRYSHRERIEMILDGERPDRFAASMWRHFYHRESTPEGLAAAMLDYQRQYDWDFMKINPRASYHVEDWGNRLEWTSSEHGKHKKVGFAVNDISDWNRIRPLSPRAPVLAEHLKAVSLIKKGLDDDLPLLMTVFSPLSIAGDLVPEQKILLDHINRDSKAVVAALENITVTFEQYVGELRDAGADGIFFATTEWATSNAMTFEKYKRFGRPYDLRIIKAAGEDALNILHICSSNNFLEQMADYPVRLVNWESYDPTNLSLDHSFELMPDKVPIGGIDHVGWLMEDKPAEIHDEIARLKERFRTKRFIFGPGCTYDPAVPSANIEAIRKSL